MSLFQYREFERKGLSLYLKTDFYILYYDRDPLNLDYSFFFILQSSNGRTDEAVAAEALANHMRCNNSFVNDLFQALYRSSLTCPTCRRQSNTFDPFLSVSLPIPQRSTRPVFVTVVYMDAQPKQVKIGLLMNQLESVKGLRQILAADTKIPEAQVSGIHVKVWVLTVDISQAKR